MTTTRKLYGHVITIEERGDLVRASVDGVFFGWFATRQRANAAARELVAIRSEEHRDQQADANAAERCRRYRRRQKEMANAA